MAAAEHSQSDAGSRMTGLDVRGPTVKSLELIRACRLGPDDPIIAVGDLDAHLVTQLFAAGFEDLTVLHPSVEALERLREVLGHLGSEITLLEADPLRFQPHRRYALWHDRGLFHRLTHAEDRQRYVEVVQQALRPEGHLVICAVGPDGPEQYEGAPVARYSASRLAAELGRQFELTEHGLAIHPALGGENHQLLHCRFRRHAPRWPR
jgi:SAM-dependent methyltransferase